MNLLTTIQLNWMNYLYFMAGGQKTKSYAMNVITAVGEVIAGAGGLWLVVISIKDIVKALSGDNKEWGKAIIALVTIVIGGGLIALGVAGIRTLADGLGSDFSNIKA